MDLERARREMNDPRITSRLFRTHGSGGPERPEDAFFFVNGKPLVNFGPIGLRALIDDEVKGCLPLIGGTVSEMQC